MQFIFIYNEYEKLIGCSIRGEYEWIGVLCNTFTLSEWIGVLCNTFTLSEWIGVLCNTFTLSEWIGVLCNTFTLSEWIGVLCNTFTLYLCCTHKCLLVLLTVVCVTGLRCITHSNKTHTYLNMIKAKHKSSQFIYKYNKSNQAMHSGGN